MVIKILLLLEVATQSLRLRHGALFVLYEYRLELHNLHAHLRYLRV